MAKRASSQWLDVVEGPLHCAPAAVRGEGEGAVLRDWQDTGIVSFGGIESPSKSRQREGFVVERHFACPPRPRGSLATLAVSVIVPRRVATCRRPDTAVWVNGQVVPGDRPGRSCPRHLRHTTNTANAITTNRIGLLLEAGSL